MTEFEPDKSGEENDEHLEEFRADDTGESTIPELDDIETVHSTGTLDGMLEWGEMPGISPDGQDEDDEEPQPRPHDD